MTPLRWTREKPTEQGWYWWRSSSCEEGMPIEVKALSLGRLIALLPNENKLLDGLTDGDWAGPLAPPEEG